MRVKNLCDPSSAIFRIPSLSDRLDLYQIVSKQHFESTITVALQEAYSLAPNPSRLLDWSAEHVLDPIGLADKFTSGLFSTLLSLVGLRDYWHPRQVVLEKLDHISNLILDIGDTSSVGIVEPLAFALAYHGNWQIHQRYLSTVINNLQWREDDSKRIRYYYGPESNYINALSRHLRDPGRQNKPLQANDITRLLGLFTSTPPDIAKSTILALLSLSIDALYKSGEHRLAKTVESDIKRIAQTRGIDLQDESLKAIVKRSLRIMHSRK